MVARQSRVNETGSARRETTATDQYRPHRREKQAQLRAEICAPRRVRHQRRMVKVYLLKRTAGLLKRTAGVRVSFLSSPPPGSRHGRRHDPPGPCHFVEYGLSHSEWRSAVGAIQGGSGSGTETWKAPRGACRRAGGGHRSERSGRIARRGRASGGGWAAGAWGPQAPAGPMGGGYVPAGPMGRGYVPTSP